MKPIYQITGANRCQNGDCFQACLATMLGRTLNQVPNFLEGLSNGGVISDSVLQLMATWLKGAGCGGFVEFGFNMPMQAVMDQIALQFPTSYYMLTGCTDDYRVHSVVCNGNRIVHDPATLPGHSVLRRACNDGFFRVGFLLYQTV